MDFCSKCGILLSLDLVGKLLCGPCDRDQKSYGRICRCEFCKTSFSSDQGQGFRHEMPANDTNSNNNNSSGKVGYIEERERKNLKSKNKKNKGRKEKQVRVKVADLTYKNEGEGIPSLEDDVGIGSTQMQKSNAQDWWCQEENPDSFNQDWSVEPIADWGLLEEPEDRGWSEPSPCDQSAGNGNDDFYVKTNTYEPTTEWTEVRKNRSGGQRFGDHDFPILERGLKESAVMESVRAEWERLQEIYRQRIEISDTPDIAQLVSGHRRKSINNSRFYVAGVDISFIKNNDKDACACLSIVRLPDLELVYQRMEMIQLTQPYIPGFLAFREVPSIISLYSKVESEAPQYLPDVIMVDGNGILHPRGCGLASQLGVLLGVPTVGVAKTLISAQGILDDDTHKMKKQKLKEAGDGFDLISDTGKVLGKCVRVHDDAPNPIYVSVGHRISLESANWIVLECSKYRIPEPVRRADLDSRDYIRNCRAEPQVFIL